MNNKEYALSYAKAGLKIFPLHWITESGKCSCGKADCIPNSNGKHTIWKCAPDSHKNATSDVTTIEKWWSEYPNANIGMACSANGIFALDVDLHAGKANGFESLDDFETTIGDEWHDQSKARIYSAVTQNTGGGGVHMLFRAPENMVSAPSGLGRNYPGIDFKFNGYILLEPSNHRSGRFYEFDKNDKGESVAFNKLISGEIPPLAPALVHFLEKQISPDYSPARFTVRPRDIDQDDFEQIREALACIPFDGIDYDEKLKVGMGLQSALPGGTGKSLYFDWLHSALGSRFKVKQSEKHWRSFKYRSGGRSIASVFEIAANFGYINEGKRGTYIDVNDYVNMELTPVAREVKEGDVIPLDKITGTTNTEYLRYLVDSDLPDGSIYVEHNLLYFPDGGFNDWQRTYLINLWDNNGMSANTDADVWSIPKTPINYPYFLDFDDDGQPIDVINPDYVPIEQTVSAQIPIGMTAANRNQTMRIPVTSDETLTRKLMEMAVRPNISGQGWPTQDQMEAAHSQLGNIRPLCALYDWHVQRSPRYAHELSLAFALMTMSTILSGRFSHRGLTSNLFAVVIAPTSIGKTVLLNLFGEVLTECAEGMRVGPKEIISDKGFYNDLKDNRAKLFGIDEWGKFQKEIFNERANSSQKLIRRSLLSVFSAFSTPSNKTASRADDKNFKAVELGPLCPSVFGITTPVDFYDSLNISFIDDGFLTRFLLMEITEDSLIGRKESITDNDQVRRIFMEWFNTARTVWKRATMDYPEWENAKCDTNCITEMDVSQDAAAALSAIGEIEDDYKKTDKVFGNVFARLRELVVRVSIIFEIAARPYSQQIELSSVELSFKLVSEILTNSYNTAKRRIAPNEGESINREIMDYFAQTQAPALYGELRSKSKLADLPPREAREVINEMYMQGRLLRFKAKERKRGAIKMFYISSQFRNLFNQIVSGDEYEEC